ncbi:MAG TPA: endonuclease domain-containing protein [Chryseosolibacter sp.]
MNRQVQTEAENILWGRLRNRKLGGFKFRRQHPIANFIADFFCLERNLVIEVDGDYHNYKEQAEYDEGRTYELKELNVQVIRFTNREIKENLGFVLSEILKKLN